MEYEESHEYMFRLSLERGFCQIQIGSIYDVSPVSEILIITFLFYSYRIISNAFRNAHIRIMDWLVLLKPAFNTDKILIGSCIWQVCLCIYLHMKYEYVPGY
jgi:hypothetical protein